MSTAAWSHTSSPVISRFGPFLCSYLQDCCSHIHSGSLAGRQDIYWKPITSDAKLGDRISPRGEGSTQSNWILYQNKSPPNSSKWNPSQYNGTRAVGCPHFSSAEELPAEMGLCPVLPPVWHLIPTGEIGPDNRDHKALLFAEFS